MYTINTYVRQLLVLFSQCKIIFVKSKKSEALRAGSKTIWQRRLTSQDKSSIGETHIDGLIVKTCNSKIHSKTNFMSKLFIYLTCT